MSVDQLRPYVRRLAERASERAFNWMTATTRTPQDLLDALPTLAGVYASSAGLLAADWYAEQDRDSRFSVTMDDDLAPEKLTSAAYRTFAGPQRPENRAREVAHRLVFDAARRTVFVNAASEGVAIARHEPAGSCNDCIASATVHSVGRNASSADIEQFFHPTCEGLFVPVRGDAYEPPSHTSQWRSLREKAAAAGNTSTGDIARWLSTR